MIEQNISKYISKKLEVIEQENRVKILVAVESGSRAWGFPSMDSDYDVRFIYLRTVDDYLSVNTLRDTIETPLVHDKLLGVPFDLSGWDLRKALLLATQSNPVLIEWLVSPIKYIDSNVVSNELFSFVNENVALDAIRYHYHRLAQNAWRQIDQSTDVKLKHYCYALRPVLCLKWISQFNEAPPMDLPTLCKDLIQDESLKGEISNLVNAKFNSKESDRVIKNKVLDKFIETVLQHNIERPLNFMKTRATAINKANTLFRKIIGDVVI